MSAFIYPDSPGAEITPGYIGEIDPEVYLCQLKLDGWRAVVTWDGVRGAMMPIVSFHGGPARDGLLANEVQELMKRPMK